MKARDSTGRFNQLEITHAGSCNKVGKPEHERNSKSSQAGLLRAPGLCLRSRADAQWQQARGL